MSEKFVFYKRTGGLGKGVMYFVKTQLQYGEILGREHESLITYEREMLAESDDFDLLYKMKRLAEGGEE